MSPLDQMVAACISVLLAITALFLAVRLIELIWPWLLAGAVLAGLVAGAVRYYRGPDETDW